MNDRKRIYRGLGFLILFLASIFTGTKGADAFADVPRFEPAACPFTVPTGAAVECGYLVVPEDRSQPQGRTIRLAVAILKSRSDDPAPDPVAYLEGGPGSSAFRRVGWLLGTPFLDSRDIIVLEQRGTRYSEPWLDCPEVGKALADSFSVALSDEEEIAREVEAAVQCRDHLIAEGVNLAAYTSVASAADFEDLRHVLGYEEWNLYGISYGTRLALTVMRDHPASIRSVILDSTYPPPADFYVEFVPRAVSSLDLLFAECAADPQCRVAYPDLRAAFYDLVERMNAEPIPLPIHGPPHTLRLTGADFALGAVAALDGTETIAFLPFLINQVQQGNPEVLIPLADQGLGPRVRSMGMFYSVECHDEAAFNPPELVEASINAHPQLGNFVAYRSDLAVCAVWETAKSDPIEDEPVHSDIPTLVLAGEYDPTTPPYWGQMAAETLSRSFFYEFRGVGHATTRHHCPAGMAAAFLDDPSVPPDASCMAAMRGPDFITDEDLYVTPAIYRLNIELLAMRDVFHLGVLGLCLLFFLAEVLLLPGNLLRLLRKRSDQTTWVALLARGVSVATAGLSLVFLVGLTLIVRETMATNWLLLTFGLPAKAAPLFIIPPLTAVLALGGLVLAVLAWKNAYWTAVGRVHYSLVALAATAFTWFLSYWDLLTFQFW
jgi:pimeloyl-ACP methyl ester carboxylesterase